MVTRPPVFAGTDRFQILREIGKGGFGIVYEVYDRDRSRNVALKVLRHAEGISLLRFKREFRALADVSHPNLVSLYELLTDGTHWFFTMELVEGETILSYVRPSANEGGSDQAAAGGYDETRLRDVLMQIAHALSALHQRRIVHRDIKPSNVLVTRQGRVVVLDFGLVSESDRGGVDDGSSADGSVMGIRVLGTPAYMAPEQGVPELAKPSADWYSVGVVLYEALTGLRPFSGGVFTQLEAKQSGRPELPSELSSGVPADLSNACMALLDPDPQTRAGAEVLTSLSGSAQTALDDADIGGAIETFVGRESHIEQLSDAFEAAMDAQTVLALVSGASGMGKTALVRQFMHRLRHTEPALLAFTSRCYERETMPYKALDPLVDALSRYLQRLPDIEVARLMPRNAAILARMFPVLRAVDEINHASEYGTSGLDSVSVRQHAAAALRELLFEMALRSPLIIAIDDAQWGDADSAAVLSQVFRPPDAPPLLLIATFRSEDAADAPVVAALSRLAREPNGTRAYDVEVGPLEPGDARQLALECAGTTDVGATDIEHIARESGGSPFFVQELTRHAAMAGGPTRLDQVVRERLASLDDGARRLITAVALSAQPIPAAIAEDAARIVPDDGEPLQRLRAARLIRTPAGSGSPTLEPYHDRIREAVTAQMREQDLTDWHLRLATVWHRSGRARPDTLATHYAGAGDELEASQHAEAAAQRAQEALAFDRAARFYKMLLDMRIESPRRYVWQVGLGDALVNAGRGYDAATAYRKAIALTGGAQSIELESRAAAELIRAGYLEEATTVLRSLLPKVGIAAPRGPSWARATLVWYGFLIYLRGINFRERHVESVPPHLLQRIDVLVAVGAPLSLISLPTGLSLNMQATWYALKARERKRVSLGLSLLAGTWSMGGTRTQARSASYAARARELADEVGDRWTIARAQLAEGICLKVSGDWRAGVQRLEKAIELFNRCPGSRWEIQTAQTLIHDSLIWLGDWKRLAQELPGRKSEADQRGDRYSSAHVAGRLSPLIHLLADRPGLARAEAEAEAANAEKPDFNLQYRAAVCTRLDIELYDGRPEKAEEEHNRAKAALAGTLRLFQNGRIEDLFYQARIALALGARGEASRLATAQHIADLMQKEHAEWASALALYVSAAVQRGRGHDTEAAGLLEQAAVKLEACHMTLYRAAVVHRRGALLGNGDGGEALIADAMAVFASQGVSNVPRMLDLLAPGPW